FINHCAAKEDGDGFLHVLNEMHHEANQALYNDNKNLKREMHLLISPDPFTKFSHIQDWHPKTKADRGLKNELVCKYWMTRVDMLAFKVGNPDQQKQIIEKYQDPDFELKADCLPVFIYDVDKIDPVKANAGLFLSPFLIRCAQYILTGPTSVGQPPKLKPVVSATVRGDNAHIMRIAEVTPPFIFYVCCVARFAMSTVPYWGEWDGSFSLFEFWDQLEYSFNDQSGAWQRNVLRFWNLKVFGAARGRGDYPVAVRRPQVESDSDVLRRQRDEERAAEAAAAVIFSDDA
ncbi:hypothetical protein V5O48_013284, partial [Marasmius crinis-equi]